MDTQSLFGKTFGQQLKIAGEDVRSKDISPNRRIPGEIVFEPSGDGGVRVTARDDQHRLLWGYVGSKGTLKQIHCLVATYETLQSLIGEELEKQGAFSADEDESPMKTAKAALEELEETVNWLKNSLDVQKETDATRERAKIISRIAADANRQITLEATNVKGMKQRSKKGNKSTD